MFEIGTKFIRIKTGQVYFIEKIVSVRTWGFKKEELYHLKSEIHKSLDLVVHEEELKMHFKRVKQTNADRIRAMSNEELAMVMMCPNENGLAEIDCDKSDSCNCYGCLLKWLQEKVEE